MSRTIYASEEGDDWNSGLSSDRPKTIAGAIEEAEDGDIVRVMTTIRSKVSFAKRIMLIGIDYEAPEDLDWSDRAACCGIHVDGGSIECLYRGR